MHDDQSIFLKSVLKALPIRCTQIGGMVTCTLTQVYENHFLRPISVSYMFPTPHRAAITKMNITAGDRRINSAILDKKDAENRYAEAVMGNDDAFFVESLRPNLNQIFIRRIIPGERVTIELELNLLPEMIDGRTQITIPTTISPRFIPCDLFFLNRKKGDETAEVPFYGETGYMAELDMQVYTSGEIKVDKSPSHSLISRKEADGVWHIGFKDGCAEADRDIVIRYQEKISQQTGIGFMGINSGKGSLLARFFPELSIGQTSSTAYSFLLDVSKSMTHKMGRALQVLDEAMGHLKDGDFFQVICFNEGVCAETDSQMRPFTGSDAEWRFMDCARIKPEGGSRIDIASMEALGQPIENIQHSILLISDGQIGNEYDAISMVRKIKEQDIRMFTIGVGRADNDYLLDALATAGNGFYERVYCDNDVQEVTARQMMRSIGPKTQNIELMWSDGTVCRDAEIKSRAIFDDDQFEMIVPVNGDEQWPLVLSGTADGTPWACKLERQNVVEGDAEILHRLYALTKIRRLEMDYYLAQNDWIAREIKHEAVDLSIRYGVVSRWTAFFATAFRPTEWHEMPIPYTVLSANPDISGSSWDDENAFDIPDFLHRGKPYSFEKEILEPHENELPDEEKRKLKKKWIEIALKGGYRTDKPKADELIETMGMLWIQFGCLNPKEVDQCNTIESIMLRLIQSHRTAGLFNLGYYRLMLVIINDYLEISTGICDEGDLLDALIAILNIGTRQMPLWAERMMVAFVVRMMKKSRYVKVFHAVIEEIQNVRKYDISAEDITKSYQAAIIASHAFKKVNHLR